MQDLAVKTVDRVAAILRALSAGGPDGVALSDIADATGLSKATVHRLLTALVGVGFAYQQLPAKLYRLGAGAIALGGSAMRHHAAGVVQPILDRLALATGDTVFASVREGGAAICVARAVGDFPIRTLTLDVGDRRPLGVGAGSLALLAALTDAEVEGVIAQNVKWLNDFQGFDPQALRALVARTRAEGHALNEGRIVSGMNAIGVVAMDPSGVPFASLSLAAIRDRMTPERVRELVGLLTAEARGLEAGLMPVPRAAVSG